MTNNCFYKIQDLTPELSELKYVFSFKLVLQINILFKNEIMNLFENYLQKYIL